MTPESQASFNPDAVTAALVGTWRFSDADQPADIGLIHFTDSGRAIQFVFNPQEPERRIPMRLWYSVESPSHLRFRPKPDHKGWLRDYRFDGDTMTFGAEGRSWVCTRLSPDEIPDWFQQFLTSALART